MALNDVSHLPSSDQDCTHFALLEHHGPDALCLLAPHSAPLPLLLHLAQGAQECTLPFEALVWLLEMAASIRRVLRAALGLLTPDVRSAPMSCVPLTTLAILVPELSYPGGDSDLPILGETPGSVFGKPPQVILAVSACGCQWL